MSCRPPGENFFGGLPECRAHGRTTGYRGNNMTRGRSDLPDEKGCGSEGVKSFSNYF